MFSEIRMPPGASSVSTTSTRPFCDSNVSRLSRFRVVVALAGAPTLSERCVRPRACELTVHIQLHRSAVVGGRNRLPGCDLQHMKPPCWDPLGSNLPGFLRALQ